MTAAEAAGTIYGGATPRLSAAQAVTPGAHALYLSIFDQGDSSLDSAVFLDRVSYLATEAGGCVAGAQSDEVAAGGHARRLAVDAGRRDADAQRRGAAPRPATAAR